MRVLTCAQSRELDRVATEEFGVPGLLLMENAAIGVADAVCDVFPEVDRVAVFCGPGANGGDGLALARHLDRRGYAVIVVDVGESDRTGDAAVMDRICSLHGIPRRQWGDGTDIDGDMSWELAIDALFGTGLSRPLSGVYAEAVQAIHDGGAPCVSIDLPSGLNGDSAQPLGPSVEADLTVTFETLKPAHVLPPACHRAGELAVADLGVGAVVGARVASRMTLVTREVAANWLPPRFPDDHKGDYGHVLVAAGSPGLAGAAVLAARGAIRAGAGLVTCAVPETLLPTVDAASLESMTLGLPDGDHGGLGEDAAAPLLQAASDRDVLAIGPGLGSHARLRDLVREVVLGCPQPVVVDASALNAFSDRLPLLEAREAATVLTPHPGELARMLGVPTAEILEDRLAAAHEASRLSGAVVLLKGHRSLTVSPEGDVYVNDSGNPGMGSGGSGDVLTGIVATFLAQDLDPGSATALSAWVHGFAGDLAAEAAAEASLAAGDLLEFLPAAMAAVEEA